MNVVTPIGIDLGKHCFQWSIASTVMALSVAPLSPCGTALPAKAAIP